MEIELVSEKISDFNFVIKEKKYTDSTKSIIESCKRNTLEVINSKSQKIDFVLPNFKAGSVGSLISPGGVGKSALSLQMCVEVAGGPIFFGNIDVGEVVFLSAEDDIQILQNRLKAIIENCTEEQKNNVVNNLHLFDLTEIDFNISINGETFLTEFLENKRLCVIDTLRMVHLSDENDSTEMSILMNTFKRIAKKTSCSILFLHHTSKSALNADSGDNQGLSRGSSVLTDNIKFQAYLQTLSEKKAKELGIDVAIRKQFAEFGLSKCNYGKPFDPKLLKKQSSKINEGYKFIETTAIEKKEASKNKNRRFS